MLQRLLAGLQTTWTVTSFLLTAPLLWPLARLRRRPDAPWVIGGHRGRMREDNAGALHAHLREPVNGAPRQPVIWVAATPELQARLEAEGHPVVRMHSLAARWAIFRAPVLIYSHGESDLELCLPLVRRFLGLRIYLNHCMNHIKAGERYSPVYEQLRGLHKRLYEWVQTDFDWLPASSPLEADNFRLSYPHKAARIVTGGGAHLDAWIRGRSVTPTSTIVWFPTFREDAEGFAALQAQVRAVTGSARLRTWLRENGRELHIGAHINTQATWGDGGLQLEAPFRWLSPASIKEALCEAAVFISDYSGLLGDWLALERPTIFFPFDLDAYLQHRRLYVDYADLAWGPLVTDAEALIDAIVDESWHDDATLCAKRDSWRIRMIPRMVPDYAHTTWQTILRLADGASR